VEFTSDVELFNCPNCGSQYKLVRVEADPTASYCRVECPHCGGPLSNREGRYILKYFLVDRPRKQIKPSRVK
jgi:ssDNA-binding Zn-finger/Zn-ribbon topoisomerase 1